MHQTFGTTKFITYGLAITRIQGQKLKRHGFINHMNATMHMFMIQAVYNHHYLSTISYIQLIVQFYNFVLFFYSLYESYLR